MVFLFMSCASQIPKGPIRPYYESPIINDMMVTFKIWDKSAREIYVIGDFNNWKPQERYKLIKGSNDMWEGTVRLSPGTYEYLFLVDGTKINDSSNKDAIKDYNGNKRSVLIVR